MGALIPIPKMGGHDTRWGMGALIPKMGGHDTGDEVWEAAQEL